MPSLQTDIKVLLVDSDAASQTKVGLFLRGDSCVNLRSTVTAEDALKAVSSQQIDVVLLSVTLLNGDGIALSKTIRKAKPSIKILMLATVADQAEVLASLTAFANGFCVKETSEECLRTAIQWVVGGGLWFDSGVVKAVLNELNSRSPEITASYQRLSEEEFAILKGMANGALLPQVLDHNHIEHERYRTVEIALLRKMSGITERSKKAADYINDKFEQLSNTKKLCLLCGEQFSEKEITCSKDGTRLVQVRKDIGEGSVIGRRYKLGKAIATGGVGLVFSAEDQVAKIKVALKLLHQEDMSRTSHVERFRREAETLSTLSHPHIVKLIDYGVESDRAYLVMKYVDGISLGQLVEETGGLPYKRAVPIFMQICEGLQYAHDNGLVHRDLTPQNIILDSQYEEEDFPIIIDFGMVKLLEKPGRFVQRLTGTGMICGTPTYMSPEQCQGKPIDHRSDIYSLGCVMYEVLTGIPPLMGPTTQETLFSHLHADPQTMRQIAPDIPEALDQIVLTTLQKDPAKRQQTMTELRDQLSRFQVLV
ncbi:MAG TPA: protein kinase [Planktothrix sp.]